ncbi:MAG: hypothetical protein C5B56_12225 [Proteobacteria bacterium]|nr:MAG: hypothetical protein C5B56_12225 [Pseudomonadota bacterium]
MHWDLHTADFAHDAGTLFHGALPLEVLAKHAAPEGGDGQRNRGQTLSRDFGDRHQPFLPGAINSNPVTS